MTRAFSEARRIVRGIQRRLRPAGEEFSRSYSQQGEDMILASFFQAQEIGFYVDIGAHHPVRLSNTYAFYRRGWRGLNIDAMPGSMTPFRTMRPRDINIEAGVAAERSVLPFYRFAEPAVNGFAFSDRQVAELDTSFHFLDRIELPTRPLREILDEHLPPGVSIDFLSVDVEGFDLAVLRSNDWTRFRPVVIVGEELSAFTLEAVTNSPLAQFLSEQDYAACGKCHHSALFVRRDYLAGANIRTAG